jgi:hypothetical protein
LQTITIDPEELIQLFPLLRIATYGSNDPTGYITLQARDGYRYWSATDNFVALTIKGETDDGNYVHLLTPQMLDGAVWAAGRSGAATISLVENEQGTFTQIRCGSYEGTCKYLGNLNKAHPLVDFTAENIGSVASIQLDVHPLYGSLEAFLHAAPVDDEGHCYVDVRSYMGRFSLQTERDLESMHISAEQKSASGSAELKLDLRLLFKVINQFNLDSTVQVRFPKSVLDPLCIISDSMVGYVMGRLSDADIVERDVANVVKETCGNLACTLTDDGNHLLRRRGIQILGSLRKDPQPYVYRVYGVLLEGVRPTVELYQELNQLNANTDFVKLVFENDAVVVYSDLLAETLDSEELGTAIDAVSDAVSKFGPVYSVVFGGSAVPPPEEVRWCAARKTIIECEIAPDRVAELNGDNGIQEWPFKSTVYVVSGYNPQGVDVDGSQVNPQIARDVLALGGRCLLGTIINPETNAHDPSVVLWGLTRDQAREIGRNAGQDAIYELNEFQTRLIECLGTREESQPRITGVVPLF